MKIVGNKIIYFEINDNCHFNNLVPLRISINNKYLGTLESPTYLPSFVGSLESILESNYHMNEMATIDNIRSILFNGYGELVDTYRITLEDTFDDFSKRIIRNRDNIFFCFKLHENPFFKYPNMNADEYIIECIPKEYYVSALDALARYISSFSE